MLDADLIQQCLLTILYRLIVLHRSETGKIAIRQREWIRHTVKLQISLTYSVDQQSPVTMYRTFRDDPILHGHIPVDVRISASVCAT